MTTATKETLHDVKARAGRLGGLKRARNHTFEQLSKMMKESGAGRPRRPTYEEIVQSDPDAGLTEKEINERRRNGQLNDALEKYEVDKSLRSLLRVVRLQYAGRLNRN